MSAEPLNFDSEVTRLIDKDPLIDAGSGIIIWGGEFPANKFQYFWDLWNFAGMNYRIWEYAHRITFIEPEVDVNCIDLLERGRIFGDIGDLSLRRDGNRLLWHFIGRFCSLIQKSDWKVYDFWLENPESKLRESTGSVLLWGEYRGKNANDEDYWQDDRVGWADLRYPSTSSKRLQVDYTAFIDGGQVAFAWWKELRSNA